MNDEIELRRELWEEIQSDFIKNGADPLDLEWELEALASVPDVLLRKISKLADRIRALEKAPIGG